MKDFMEFVRKQGVVELAVGFIIGVVTAGVVTALVNDLINPLKGLVLQTRNLNTLVFHIGKATFRYGDFINVLINFTVLLAIVYLLFKVLCLEKLDIVEEETSGT